MSRTEASARANATQRALLPRCQVPHTEDSNGPNRACPHRSHWPSVNQARPSPMAIEIGPGRESVDAPPVALAGRSHVEQDRRGVGGGARMQRPHAGRGEHCWRPKARTGEILAADFKPSRGPHVQSERRWPFHDQRHRRRKGHSPSQGMASGEISPTADTDRRGGWSTRPTQPEAHRTRPHSATPAACGVRHDDDVTRVRTRQRRS